ncbi:hypothetical protein NQD34_009437 [Periophthalmus magnuspinnatus]|nr:hypothetical protein NQD34_009437 [Periophthalmus magnuspinnatus]
MVTEKLHEPIACTKLSLMHSTCCLPQEFLQTGVTEAVSTGRHLDRFPHRLAAERTLKASLWLFQKLVIKPGHVYAMSPCSSACQLEVAVTMSSRVLCCPLPVNGAIYLSCCAVFQADEDEGFISRPVRCRQMGLCAALVPSSAACKRTADGNTSSGCCVSARVVLLYLNREYLRVALSSQKSVSMTTSH